MGKAAISKKGAARSKATKVIVVDDHQLVCRGFADLISQEPDLKFVGDAADAQQALALVDEQRPDVAIIDISLKNGSGVELIRDIKKKTPQAKVLVASMHDESMYAERVLRAGASGYINKREAPELLLSAIRCVIKGELHFSPRLAERLVRRNPDGGEPTIRASIERLSAREKEIFEMVGKGLPTREIAVILGVSVKTVETHRENIKRKLRLKSSLELARRAIAWALESGEPPA
jgi:DNA-binding NarL/FixJ family response regulator